MVFPTCVGMNRDDVAMNIVNVCVPHMRGDEPSLLGIQPVVTVCSPHAWG